MKNTAAIIIATPSLTEKKILLSVKKSLLTVLSSFTAQIKNLQASGSGGVFHFSTVSRGNYSATGQFYIRIQNVTGSIYTNQGTQISLA